MKHIIVGTAGHIDHGKSALVEALTGVDPDRLQEEKARGITIDLGFARYSHGETQLAFVDVPGHERFVRNMLAGASGIDCVLLVVAADESVMPQTREHFEICRLLNVPNGLVALTKSDLADDETQELVRLEVRELVADSFLEDAPIVPVSSRTGIGIDELRAALARIAEVTPGRSDTGIVRLPIDRAFTVKGFGTVITGTQVSGRIVTNSELVLLPAGRRLKMRGLQVHGVAQLTSKAGQRVAVNLSGIEVGELKRGDTLAGVGTLESTRRFDGIITLLAGAPPLKHGARVRFHQGTTEVMARVALGATADPTGTDGKFDSALQPGTDSYARLRLERIVALTRGDRFVLRAYSPSVTIAGGTVLDPRPPRGRLRSAAGVVRLRRLRPSADPTLALEVMIEEAGGEGLSRQVLTSRAGVSPIHLDAVCDALAVSGRAVAVGDLLVSPAHLRSIEGELLAAVETYHRTHPLDDGLPREEARGRVGRRASAEVFDYVVVGLVTKGTIVATGKLALASHRISLSPEEKSVRDGIDRLFRDGGLTPPDVTDLAETLGANSAVVERMLQLLVRQRRLEKIDSLMFHVEPLGRLKDEVRAMKSVTKNDPVRIDVAAFKERYGVTRKYAIPLLGYLDRERVTRRVGRGRILI